MVAVGLALATALIWGAVDFVAGVKSRSSGPLAVIAISQPVGLVLIAVVTAARGEAPPDSAHLLYAAAAGAASVVGLTALYQGLAVGLMSVVAPITATGAVIPVLVGIARGENPSWLQGIGLPIALLGVVLASLEPRGTRQGQGRVAAGVASRSSARSAWAASSSPSTRPARAASGGPCCSSAQRWSVCSSCPRS